MGEHGTIDWSLAAGEKSLWSGGGDFREWDWQHIIYCVRDPRESIASIAYTENTEISFEFRKKFERRIGDKSKIVSAIASILKWDQLITSKNPSIIYRIEDESEKLFNYLNKNIDVIKWSDSQVNVKYNQREHGTFKELLEIPGYIPNRFKRGINQYCEKYGYDKLF
jgi:hypothetical protein